MITRLSEALRDLVRPFLVVIEDAHWADDATLDLIRHLARRCTGWGRWCWSPTGSRRPSDSTAAIGAGRRRERVGIRRIDLAPLTLDAVRRLVGTAGTVDAEELYRRPGATRSTSTGDRGRRERRPAERARRRVVADRAADGRARDSLEVVALAGRAPSCPSSPRWRPGARPASTRRRRRRAPAPGVHADVPPRARAAVRGRGGAAAAPDRPPPTDPGGPRRDPGADPARRAHHAEAAGLGDEAARHALVAAAAPRPGGAQGGRPAVRARAPSQRQRPAEDRAGCWPPCRTSVTSPAASRRRTTARREALAIWVGVGDVDEIGDAQRWLSRLSWFAGDSADARAYAIAACETLAGRGTPDEAMALSNRAQLTMLAGDLAGTRDWAGRALRCSTRCRRALRSRTCGCTRSTTSARSSLESGDAVLGARLLQESLDRAVRPTCTSTRRAPSPTWVAGRASAPARGRSAAPRDRPRLLPRAGPRRLGPLHAGLARHQPALRGTARRGDRSRPSRSCATPAPPRSAGSARCA